MSIVAITEVFDQNFACNHNFSLYRFLAKNKYHSVYISVLFIIYLDNPLVGTRRLFNVLPITEYEDCFHLVTLVMRSI